MQRISLCMIVRNEEQFLPGCLASVRGLVDEIVVVDTGSTDRTKEIALQAGAIVVSREWADDFAAARNVALEIASGDWILSLDADECLTEDSHKAIRAAVERPRGYCGLLRLLHASHVDATPEEVLGGAVLALEPIWLARLFRNAPDLRWHGRVHEHVNPWLTARGGAGMPLDADIIHYGAIPAVRDALGKDQRNLRLLHLEVEEEPDCWSARACLAEILYVMEGVDAARDEAATAWRQVRDDVLPDLDSVPGGVVKALTVHLVVQLDDNAWDAAIGEIRTARKLGVNHPNLDYVEGLVRENLALREPQERSNHLSRARRAYERALEFEDRPVTDPVLDGATTWGSRYRMGLVFLQQNEPLRAERILREAQRLAPDSQEVAMAIAESLLELERPADALKQIEPLLCGDQAAADPWLLAADACRRLGDQEAFETCLNNAYSRVRSHLLGLHRLDRLNTLLQASAAS